MFLFLFIVENDTVQYSSDFNIDISADNVNNSSKSMVVGIKPKFFINDSIYSEEVVQKENKDEDKGPKIACYEKKMFKDSSSAVDETITLSESEWFGVIQKKNWQFTFC